MNLLYHVFYLLYSILLTSPTTKVRGLSRHFCFCNIFFQKAYNNGETKN